MTRKLIADSDLDLEKGLEAVLRGRATPHIHLSDAEMSTLSALEFVADLTQRPKAITKGVYVVEIYDPRHNWHYHTLSIDGTIHFTRNGQFGAFDPSRLFDSLEPLLQVFASNGVPLEVNVRKRKTGEPSDPRKPTDRSKPRHLFDPALIDYASKKARYLISTIIAKEMEEGRTIGEEEIGLLSPDLQVHVASRGLNVRGETIENFVGRNKRKILSARQVYENALLDDEAVSTLVPSFLAFAQSIAKSSKPSEMAEKFFAQSGHAISVYQWFKINNQSGHSTDNVSGALRDHFVRTYAQPGLITSELFDKVKDATSEWQRLCVMVVSVENDPALKKLGFETFAAASGSTTASDRSYEGIRQLRRRVVHERGWTVNEYRYLVGCLAALGHLKTEALDSKHPRAQRGDERDRLIEGIEAQFVTPFSHLVQRLTVYAPLLDSVFERYLRGGVETKTLRKQKDDANLARVLDNSLIEIERPKFSSLKDSSKPLNDDYRHQIIQAYVSVQREEINARLSHAKS